MRPVTSWLSSDVVVYSRFKSAPLSASAETRDTYSRLWEASARELL